jgi:Zn-dependent peptidase ImmA (M78 family)
MRFLTEKLSYLKIGWNERALTETDFFRLCKRFRIKVTEMPLSSGGFYYRVMGTDFIAVDSKLTGPEKLFVLFHELGHYLLHVPDGGVTANFHGVGLKTRKEREADLFALCAILPKNIIEDQTVQTLTDEGFPAEMVAQRLAVYESKGI